MRSRADAARFNGAAAEEPRKAGGERPHEFGVAASMGPRLKSRGKSGSSPATSRRSGFNGAAAEEPRKAGELRPAPRRVDASMGPRLKSRGKGSASA